MPELRAFEVKLAVENLKGYKSPDADRIPTELMVKQEAGKFLLSSINLLILFGIRRNCLSSGGGNYCTHLEDG